MKKISDVLQSFYDHLNINDKNGFGTFLNAWDQLVGPDLSAHCQPGNIKNGMLIVEVDHPGWLQKFKMHESRILKELMSRHSQLGIRRIAYQHVDDASRRKPLKVESTEPEETRKTRSSDGEKDLDPELLDSLEQLRRSLEKRQKDGSN